MDEFTFHSFAPECQLISLSPQNWEVELDGFAPDLVFIESAWRGAGEQWTQKVSNPSAEIMGVIAWCVRAGVPSVFWNKEDPVHFGSFLHASPEQWTTCSPPMSTALPAVKRDLGHERFICCRSPRSLRCTTRSSTSSGAMRFASQAPTTSSTRSASAISRA